MKIYEHVLVSGLSIMLGLSFAWAGDFEGILHMKTTNAGMDMVSTLDWYIQGEKARLEMQRGDGKQHFMIVDGQSRTMLMPDGRQEHVCGVGTRSTGGKGTGTHERND